MMTKQQTMIPPGTKITKCPPGSADAKSVWTLLRKEEKKLEREAELKAQAKKFEELLKQGVPVAEALKQVL